MSTLSRILGGGRVLRGGGYRPFTQPPYRGSYPLGRRVLNGNTNALLYQSLATGIKNKFKSLPVPKSTNYLYEDRRLWHPLGPRAFPKSKTQAYPKIDELPAKIKSYQYPPGSPIRRIGNDDVDTRTGEVLYHRAYDPFKISWDNPYKMIICLKRAMRREVMHALGYAGKTGFKKPKYTQYSTVRCF